LEIGKTDLEALFGLMDKDGSGDVSYYEFAEELANIKNARIQTMLSFTRQHVLQVNTVVQQIAEAVLPPEAVHRWSKRCPDSDCAGSPDGFEAPFSVSPSNWASKTFRPTAVVPDEDSLPNKANDNHLLPCDRGDLDELVQTLKTQAHAVLEQARSVADSACNGAALAAALHASAEVMFHNTTVKVTQTFDSACKSAAWESSSADIHAVPVHAGASALAPRLLVEIADSGKTSRRQEAGDASQPGEAQVLADAVNRSLQVDGKNRVIFDLDSGGIREEDAGRGSVADPPAEDNCFAVVV